jgi:hypothetical protein
MASSASIERTASVSAAKALADTGDGKWFASIWFLGTKSHVLRACHMALARF